MNNKELHYFIGSCLSLDYHPELKDEISREIKANSIEWDRFVWICSNNLILPSIWVKFRDHNLNKLLPEDLASFLEEIYNLNLNRNTAILKQIDELVEYLNSQNIHPVFIKGAGNLIDKLYSDPGERILSDIDLLVPEEHFLLSANILESKGYKTVQHLYEPFSEMMHYPSLHREDVAVPVEIHRTPVLPKWSKKLNNSIVSGDKKVVANRPVCFVPSDKHKLYINFIHSQLSNNGSVTGLVSFRDLYDASLLTKRHDLGSFLNEIPFKKSAISYILLSNRMITRDPKISIPETFGSHLFSLHYDLNLSSKAYYHTFRLSRSIGKLIFVDILFKIPSVLFKRNVRKTWFAKMSSKSWYKDHLKSYRDRFN